MFQINTFNTLTGTYDKSKPIKSSPTKNLFITNDATDQFISFKAKTTFTPDNVKEIVKTIHADKKLPDPKTIADENLECAALCQYIREVTDKKLNRREITNLINDTTDRLKKLVKINMDKNVFEDYVLKLPDSDFFVVLDWKRVYKSKIMDEKVFKRAMLKYTRHFNNEKYFSKDDPERKIFMQCKKLSYKK